MALHSVFSWFMKKRFHQIELFMKYPNEVQSEVFDKLITACGKTEIGAKYGIEEGISVRAFRERMPLHTYDDLKPYVDRLKQGEQNIIWPGYINWFAKSSGTTNDRSKFIPVSKEALEDCHYKAGKDLLAVYNHNHPTNNIYDGKSLVLGGSSQINEFRKDSYYGDLSAIIINNLPFWVEFRRVPERQIALMEKWEDKIDVMAKSVMNEDVTNMAGVPSWTLVLLRKVLEFSGKSNISEVWPNLELYLHGGVNFDPYKNQFAKLIDLPSMQYYQTYNASEGFFGIQESSGADDMLLMLDYGIFYEFIDIDSCDQDQPETILLEDVKCGVNYEMVITTNGGLWRYRIGDTVMFTSTSPFKIRVTGRTKHFINAFGEELIIDNAEKAISVAMKTCQCAVTDYTAGPVYMGQSGHGAHEWLIEFQSQPDSIEHFTQVLDDELRKLNSDYDAKRTGNLTLGTPVVKIMPSGTFYNWLKMKGKLGGQHKTPRLSNHRKLIEEILEMKNEVSVE
jgi:hypothetical protein